ncbi:exopolysaccharide biosynthesis glycosyltransferase VpsD [Vibrio cholerae]|uniref:exopolysaccharide biosynthesis glycosyltransferase VpsD n=1 Tax=Vibrio cholerae TaxID=666 RepID=UPI00295150E0|nr:exopolysaccharide biosynthesis glycosyltransferase VpsD [Vibrio cholerae]EIC9802682.1 exopolysaccharide biosynthesis glycosyltransferase VpsD [Vibrio cholerae]ELS9246619.1 exopolysaccharide biosynthesis glycosyltransferase VpsD [Vibrio cholerae]MEB3764131.1 glycosyltransferase [Vibrio cholerae]
MSKILLIMPLSTLNWGEKNLGGVDSVCQMLVRQLAQQERPYYYRVLAFDPLNNHSYSGEIIQLSKHLEVVICPLREKRFGLPLPSLLSNWLRIQEQLKDYQPDLVHSHLNSWMMGLGQKTRNVLTLHSYRKIGRKPVSKLNDFVYEQIIPWVSNFSVDFYTCVGEELRQALSLETNKPIQMIGNPVDPDYFSANSANQNLPQNEVNLVTCALITRRKRIDRAIVLLRELKQRGQAATLRIIGPNMDSAYYAQLQQLIKEYELEQEVIFLGKLNQREIVQQYQQANIGIFTSQQETFGLAPLEMMAAGLPLISTPVGILGERQATFDQLGVVFMQEGQEAMIAERISQIKITDTQAIQTYLRDQFAVENVIEHYQNLYREVLS